jgi:SNF2 family DNA or RNA helicase
MFPYEKLRPYQMEDVEFLAPMNSCALFNDPRTGKTPTYLAMLDRRHIERNLIVCPSSAIPAWEDEYAEWLPGRHAVPCIGTEKQRSRILDNWDDGLLISYDTLKTIVRGTGDDRRVFNAELEFILRHLPPAMATDEAHRIKNRESARSEAVCHLDKVLYKTALTGTPGHGKQQDIWPILNWLFPQQFNSYWKFIEEYFVTTLEHNLSTGRPYKKIHFMKPEKARDFQMLLSVFATSRKRKDVMPWLPEKDYQPIRLTPTTEQKRYLQELKDYFETENIVTKGILDRLMRYRQICMAPELLDLKGKSPKIEWILSYLIDYPDRPLLIFSNFTSFLNLLAAKLYLRGVLFAKIIGATPIPERGQIVKKFQEGRLNVLLLNTVAGKENLTLDRAETTIFCDKYPPIGDIQQAEDRFVATTPERANKPHTIIELMMKGTYDEQIHKLLKRNASETDIINDFGRYIR